MFKVKDGGKRKKFRTGMIREPSTDKPRYDLVWKPGLKRVAMVMAHGASKYSPRNWELASTQEELDRFLESANRHFEQFFAGEVDEDHGAQCVFNIFGAMMVREKLSKPV